MFNGARCSLSSIHFIQAYMNATLDNRISQQHQNDALKPWQPPLSGFSTNWCRVRVRARHYPSGDDFMTQLGLTVCSTASEGCTQLTVLVRQIEHMLGQIGRLHNAPDFYSTFLFDQLSNSEEKIGRVLYARSIKFQHCDQRTYLGIPSVLPGDQSY